MQELKKKTDGFTIIEVMIVLVIAAVIILIVFLAVPALQRNSRNTQRRNDVGRILASLTEHASNNNGSFPTTTTEQTNWKNSIGTLSFYKDTTNNINYGLSGNTVYPTTASSSTSTSTVWVRIGHKCNGGVLTTTGASARTIAAMYAVETGGNPQLVCTES